MSMDVSSYFTGSFLKVEDFADGETMQATITKVEEGKYEKLVLTLDNGSLLSLNATNGRALAKAFGYESNNWIRKSIELTVGEVLFKGELQPSVMLKPISPPPSGSDRRLPVKPEPDSPADDDAPF
jgi:hypothetical protein